MNYFEPVDVYITLITHTHTHIIKTAMNSKFLYLS